MTRSLSLILALTAALCSSATAQTLRSGDDPQLNPDYDPNKPAAVTTTTTTTTRAQAPLPGGMPRNAFLFEARLSLGGAVASGGAVTDGGGNAVSSNIPSLIAEPSLLLGARLLDRLQIGFGISFVRIGSNGISSNNVLFIPSVAVDLVKSRDNKTAFYLKAGLGFGASIASVAGVHDTSAIVDFDVALGARHALSSNFALGFESGLAASVTNPGENAQTDVVFVYGAIVGTFWSGNGR